MRRTSRRAAASDGVPNLRFVQAPAERLPAELTGVTELHVILPWGSLRQAALGTAPGVLRGLAGACLPGARFQVAVNLPAGQAGQAGQADPEWAMTTLAASYAGAGWRLEHAGYLSGPEVAALRSSWANRLRSARRGRLDVLGLTGGIPGP